MNSFVRKNIVKKSITSVYIAHNCTIIVNIYCIKNVLYLRVNFFRVAMCLLIFIYEMKFRCIFEFYLWVCVLLRRHCVTRRFDGHKLAIIGRHLAARSNTWPAAVLTPARHVNLCTCRFYTQIPCKYLFNLR